MTSIGSQGRARSLPVCRLQNKRAQHLIECEWIAEGWVMTLRTLMEMPRTDSYWATSTWVNHKHVSGTAAAAGKGVGVS
jgi:hypothetical protein